MTPYQFVATTREEAERDYRFCGRCGRALIEDAIYEYDRASGGRNETPIRRCPNRSASDTHHDFVEILEEGEPGDVAIEPPSE